MKFQRIALIVLDSVGIGALPDADRYGDEGAHTLGHIAEQVADLSLPNLERLGLGNIAELKRIPPVSRPLAHYGKMAEKSCGKDTLTGHWELMGLYMESAFEVYPNGFPAEWIRRFEKETGRAVIGNKPASGTEIIAELGEQQIKSGAWIVYTSADSVMQIAAHEDVIPLDELYAACEMARRMTLDPPYRVGRIIARPYVGEPGNFRRTENRRDFAVKPPGRTVLHELQKAGFDCIGIGKIGDIFSMEGLTESWPTSGNGHGMELTAQKLGEPFRGLLFTNLVDFDSKYGHRRDPQGYARALKEFDAGLPGIMAGIGERDLLIITADHGNDPTHHGTDHTREYVPLLAWNPAMREGRWLGVRSTFADVGATIADNFAAGMPAIGKSFLPALA